MGKSTKGVWEEERMFEDKQWTVERGNCEKEKEELFQEQFYRERKCFLSSGTS